MQNWNRRLAQIGEVILFDYPYFTAGRRRPDPLPRLIEAHRDVVVRARGQTDGPLVLVGKSMGGRVGCHVAALEKVDALVCLGYPLCAAGDPTRLRDKVLRALSAPVLFVQGTRDPLCPLELLESVRRKMTTRTALHIVENGDHSLLVGKRQLQAQALTQDTIDQEIAAQISNFVRETTTAGKNSG
jgi:predicted alpha/beta-hydrolase family hydrolase